MISSHEGPWERDKKCLRDFTETRDDGTRHPLGKTMTKHFTQAFEQLKNASRRGKLATFREV